MITLQILGSGSATPTINRGVTAQYLNFNERRILIDCGEGTQIQLRKFGVKFQRIQYIFISHLHGDHYLGLPGLLASMHLLGRVIPIHIFAPPELELIINQQFKLTHVHLNFELIFHSLKSDSNQLIFEDNLMTVMSIPLKHRIPCSGFLFKEKIKERKIDQDIIQEYGLSIPEIQQLKKGIDIERNGELISNEKLTLDPPNQKSYAFCTDTKYLSNLHESILNVDVLYHEATFLESERERAKSTFHSTAIQAATVAKEASVGKLLLGHFSARYRSAEPITQEAKTVFENSVSVNDGDKYII